LLPIPVALPTQLPSNITKAFNDLESLMNSRVNSTTVPGIAAGLVYRDKVLWSKGVGTIVKGKTSPPTTTTVFRIGSVSKVFATLVVYQLFERRLLHSLDDPLVKYYPTFTIKSLTNENITIRQMLAQMSGLPREAPCGPDSISGSNVCSTTTETIIQHLSDMHVIRPPWTRPSYSNLAYSLLGRILVEKVFYPGTTYEQYVRDYILMPLGMKNTGFEFTDDVIKSMATGYNVDGSSAVLADLGWNRPCGQMYSTVADLNTFSQFFYEAYNFSYYPLAINSIWHPGGKTKVPFAEVLSAQNRRMMGQPVFWNPDGLTQFGTPFEIRTQSHYSIRRKGGNIVGFSAAFTYIPELQLGLNVLFSGLTDEFSFVNQAYDILIPAFYQTLVNMLPKAPPSPPSTSSYVGTYAGSGQTAIIKDYQSSLVITVNGLNVYLAYISEGVFRIYLPYQLVPCMQGELLAYTGEWVYFSNLQNNMYQTMTVPGFRYNIQLTRQ
jgi:CubicO group peptidase (beta-lactamase class C family)